MRSEEAMWLVGVTALVLPLHALRLVRLSYELAADSARHRIAWIVSGLTLGVFASVTLTRHSEENVADFERFVASVPEVLEKAQRDAKERYGELGLKVVK